MAGPTRENRDDGTRFARLGRERRLWLDVETLNRAQGYLKSYPLYMKSAFSAPNCNLFISPVLRGFTRLYILKPPAGPIISLNKSFIQ
jgi:hypothetical protein